MISVLIFGFSRPQPPGACMIVALTATGVAGLGTLDQRSLIRLRHGWVQDARVRRGIVAAGPVGTRWQSKSQSVNGHSDAPPMI